MLFDKLRQIEERSEELTRAGRQKSLAFLAGNCVVVCVEPRGEAQQRRERVGTCVHRARITSSASTNSANP